MQAKANSRSMSRNKGKVMTLSPLAKHVLIKNAKEYGDSPPEKRHKKEPTAFERSSTFGDLCNLESLFCDEKLEDHVEKIE